MINLGISLGVAILFASLLIWLGVNPPLLGILLGLIPGTGLFIYFGKRMQEKLEKIFLRASEQIKRQQFDPAIETMKEGYKLAPWQFLVKGSIDGQIGTLQYMRNKHTEAEPLLKSASMNHYFAKAMLAILYWKRGERGTAKKIFDTAVKAGKKDSLIYALYAYVLNEMHERDSAINILNQGLKKCKDDERLLSNRTLLQNKKPMKMKVYGEQWYQFMLERPVIRQGPPPFARMSKRMVRG
ncbi:MAG: hypothetical protein FWG02_04915 [Holophagaceae bacterium]|nr:hypothetical protein [Holophagaceae bacterium]